MSSMGEHWKTRVVLQKSLPFFQVSVAHLEHLSESGHLCKPKPNL